MTDLKAFVPVMDAICSLIDEQGSWSSDGSTGTWTGSSLRTTLIHRTGLGEPIIDRILRALKSLGVITSAPARRTGCFELGAPIKQHCWTLMKPYAKIVCKNGMFKLAEEE